MPIRLAFWNHAISFCMTPFSSTAPFAVHQYGSTAGPGGHTGTLYDDFHGFEAIWDITLQFKSMGSLDKVRTGWYNLSCVALHSGPNVFFPQNLHTIVYVYSSSCFSSTFCWKSLVSRGMSTCVRQHRMHAQLPGNAGKRLKLYYRQQLASFW